MCEAVLISQKPPLPSARRCGVIALWWVWPLTHAITCGWVSRYVDDGAAEHPRERGSPPVRMSGFDMVVLVWWL